RAQLLPGIDVLLDDRAGDRARERVGLVHALAVGTVKPQPLAGARQLGPRPRFVRLCGLQILAWGDTILFELLQPREILFREREIASRPPRVGLPGRSRATR